jgi:hypothetical protein
LRILVGEHFRERCAQLGDVVRPVLAIDERPGVAGECWFTGFERFDQPVPPVLRLGAQRWPAEDRQAED